MGLYAKYVLPRFIEVAMRNKDTKRLRAEWVPYARGQVLEVGIGSGLNLAFYTLQVQRVYGVDPSAELQRMARKRTDGSRLNVEFFSQSAEDALPLPDKSIDTVVNDVDALLDSRPVESPQSNQAGDQAERTDDFYRAWSRARFWRCGLARPIKSSVEANRRRVQPEPQN